MRKVLRVKFEKWMSRLMVMEEEKNVSKGNGQEVVIKLRMREMNIIDKRGKIQEQIDFTKRQRK